VEYNDDDNNNNNNRPKRLPSHHQPFYERLKGKNPWPTSFQPTLEPATKNYASEVCALADILRDSLCLALELDPGDAIHDKFLPPNNDTGNEVPHWVIKLVSYPPPPSGDATGRSFPNGSRRSIRGSNDDDESALRHERQGVGAHTDTNFLTLVLQEDSSSGGLQAFSRGEWIDVNLPSSAPPFGTGGTDNSSSSSSSNSNNGNGSNDNDDNSYLICNLGEQAETWSRGYFLATPHRVIMKQPSLLLQQQQKQQPRTSVPLFYNPVLSATMGPLDKKVLENVRWERPKEYQKQQQWRRPNNLMNPSVGENTFKSLARSHPEVFAKHHPDLELLKDGRIVPRRR